MHGHPADLALVTQTVQLQKSRLRHGKSQWTAATAHTCLTFSDIFLTTLMPLSSGAAP